MSERDVLLVVQKGDHSLGYYDFITGAELDRVMIDRFPHEFTLSRDQRLAYMAHFGVALAHLPGDGGNTVSVVDLAARQRVGTVTCGQYRRLHDVALDAKGALYILSEASNRLLISKEPATGAVDVGIPTGGIGSHMVTVKRDGSMAFCSNMTSGTVSALFPDDPERPPVLLPVGKQPEGSVLDDDERRLFVVNRESAEIHVIDAEHLVVKDVVRTPPGPVRICRDPGLGLLVALYHGRGLLILDPDDLQRQRVVSLPDKAISVSYHAESGAALLSTHAHCVCVVDTAASVHRRSIPTRGDPDPTAVVRLDI